MRHFVAIAAVLVLWPAAAGARLCPKCRGQMYIMSVGQCVECGGHAGSGAFKLCKACSDGLGQCEHCRAALAARPERPKAIATNDVKELATRRFGKWTHRTYYANATSRSRVSVGELTYDGKAIPLANDGDFLWSPWGKLVCHRKRYRRGWLRPHPDHPPKGKEIASPDPATSARVRRRIRDVEAGLKEFEVTVRFADVGPQPGPSLALTTRGADRILQLAGVKQVTIAEPDARGIIARLATEDFFARALDERDRTMIRVKAMRPPWYALGVKIGQRRSFDLKLRWGPETLRCLDALRSGLKGNAAKAVGEIMAPAEKKREEWRKLREGTSPKRPQSRPSTSPA